MSSKEPKQRIYIDSCILIAHFSTAESEKKKREIVDEFLCLAESLEDTEFVTSQWAISEMVNILISNHHMSTKQVSIIEETFTNAERLGKTKVYLVDTSLMKDYTVKEFLYHVRGAVLKSHPGLADAMHSVIMKNNEISSVLTFDSDFSKIPDLTVLSPKSFLNARN